MIIQLRNKSQITIPKEIIKKLGLLEGDQLEVFESNGEIHLLPVVVYPKEYLEKLKKEIQTVKEQINNGDRPVFNTIDALIDSLEES